MNAFIGTQQPITHFVWELYTNVNREYKGIKVLNWNLFVETTTDATDVWNVRMLIHQ